MRTHSSSNSIVQLYPRRPTNGKGNQVRNSQWLNMIVNKASSKMLTYSVA